MERVKVQNLYLYFNSSICVIRSFDECEKMNKFSSDCKLLNSTMCNSSKTDCIKTKEIMYIIQLKIISHLLSPMICPLFCVLYCCQNSIPFFLFEPSNALRTCETSNLIFKVFSHQELMTIFFRQ